MLTKVFLLLLVVHVILILFGFFTRIIMRDWPEEVSVPALYVGVCLYMYVAGYHAIQTGDQLFAACLGIFFLNIHLWMYWRPSIHNDRAELMHPWFRRLLLSPF